MPVKKTSVKKLERPPTISAVLNSKNRQTFKVITNLCNSISNAENELRHSESNLRDRQASLTHAVEGVALRKKILSQLYNQLASKRTLLMRILGSAKMAKLEAVSAQYLKSSKGTVPDHLDMLEMRSDG